LTLFDTIALIVLVVSVLIGLVRGAMRELIAVVAFTVSIMLALWALPVTGPLAGKAVHSPLAAKAVAIALVFIGAYIALRVIGAALARRVRAVQGLDAADRAIGGVYGVLRGLAFLGIFYLAFTAAIPADRMPNWISNAVAYPIARASGVILRAAAPEGFAMAERLTPSIRKALQSRASDAQSSDAGQTGANAYDAPARKGLDDVAEKSW
jgi:membrane protein required for colicin V production